MCAVLMGGVDDFSNNAKGVGAGGAHDFFSPLMTRWPEGVLM